MPAEAQEPDPARAQPRPAFPRGGPTAEEKTGLREKLMALRAQLLRSNKDLADEALKGSGQDFKVDHMADYGSDNQEQDVSLSLLEGETELLEAIEKAIRKIDGVDDQPFGICEDCAGEPASWGGESAAPWIPTGRLQAVPYAEHCVPHQEAREEA